MTKQEALNEAAAMEASIGGNWIPSIFQDDDEWYPFLKNGRYRIDTSRDGYKVSGYRIPKSKKAKEIPLPAPAKTPKEAIDNLTNYLIKVSEIILED